MTLTPHHFRPCNGTVYANLFANKTVGLKRNLFWSICIDFSPFEFGGAEEKPNFMAEWLTYPDPEQLFEKGGVWNNSTADDGEASCYFQSIHMEALKWQISLRPIQGQKAWAVDYEFTLESSLMSLGEEYDLEDLDEAIQFDFRGSTTLRFDKFHVSKDCIEPRLNTIKSANDLLRKHIAIKEDLVGTDADFQFLFHFA